MISEYTLGTITGAAILTFIRPTDIRIAAMDDLVFFDPKPSFVTVLTSRKFTLPHFGHIEANAVDSHSKLTTKCTE